MRLAILLWFAHRAAASTHEVSGGVNGVSPYYTITPALPASLQAGTTYIFNAAGISSSHPFAIGSQRGTHQGWMTGSFTGMSGSSGSITVAVPSDYTGNVVYYCTIHTSMTFTMSVTGATVASPPPSPPPPSPPPPPPPVPYPPNGAPPPYTTPSPTSEGGGLSGGAIAGIVVGVVVVIGAGVAIATSTGAFAGVANAGAGYIPTLGLSL